MLRIVKCKKFFFQISDATTLSWSTRIKGFIICFVIGVSFSVLVSLDFTELNTYRNFESLVTVSLDVVPLRQALGQWKQLIKQTSESWWDSGKGKKAGEPVRIVLNAPYLIPHS